MLQSQILSKLAMEEGHIARFARAANGSMVNFDLHGDGGRQSSNDKQGRAVSKIPGVLLAAFTSNHRW
ncbi:hypothetical protein MED193_02165 [Roseobacter sp. MED193]|nr:hypothetical protein MED193_02165 [Roseobacter sp. MED193]